MNNERNTATKTTYTHTVLYVVRVVERPSSGDPNTWFTGPYGSTGADLVADELEAAAKHERACYVEALFEGPDSLTVVP